LAGQVILTCSAFFIILGNLLRAARLSSHVPAATACFHPHHFPPRKEAVLPPKKKRDTNPDLRVKYLADGTAIYPVVNGMEIFPALVEHVNRFDNLLQVMAGYDPQGFHIKTPVESVILFMKLARHWADMYGADYKEIDRQAHAIYSEERWTEHETHYGDKV
jgi:hypothetical protein